MNGLDNRKIWIRLSAWVVIQALVVTHLSPAFAEPKIGTRYQDQKSVPGTKTLRASQRESKGGLEELREALTEDAPQAPTETSPASGLEETMVDAGGVHGPGFGLLLEADEAALGRYGTEAAKEFAKTGVPVPKLGEGERVGRSSLSFSGRANGIFGRAKIGQFQLNAEERHRRPQAAATRNRLQAGLNFLAGQQRRERAQSELVLELLPLITPLVRLNASAAALRSAERRMDELIDRLDALGEGRGVRAEVARQLQAHLEAWRGGAGENQLMTQAQRVLLAQRVDALILEGQLSAGALQQAERLQEQLEQERYGVYEDQAPEKQKGISFNGVSLIAHLISFARIPTQRLAQRLAQSSAKGRIPLELWVDHDRLLDIPPLSDLRYRGEERVMRLDLTTPHRVNGFDAGGQLYGLALFNQLQAVVQAAEPAGPTPPWLDPVELGAKENLLTSFTCYETWAPQAQQALAQTLKDRHIDSGHHFRWFLTSGAYGTPLEKELAAERLMGRTRLVLEYDQGDPDDPESIISILESETDLEVLSDRIAPLLTGSASPAMAAANAARVGRWAQSTGRLLVGTRAGLASFVEAIAMAGARQLSVKELEAQVRGLVAWLDETRVDLQTPELGAVRDFSAVRGVAMELVNLAGQKTVFDAQLQGAIQRFDARLGEFHASVVKELRSLRTEQAGVIAREKAASGRSRRESRLARDLAVIQKKVDQLDGIMSALKEARAQAPKGEPVQVIIFQRPSARGVRNIAVGATGKDIYFSTDPKLNALLAKGAHNAHFTPFERVYIAVVDVLVEPLPAYANFFMLELKGGRNELVPFVDRKAMLAMFSNSSDSMRQNIRHRFESWWIGMAQRIVARQMQAEDEVERIQREHGVDEADALRWLIWERGWEPLVGQVAAVAERTRDNLLEQVFSLKGKYLIDERDALELAVRDDSSTQNLLGRLRDQAEAADEPFDQFLDTFTRRHRLIQRGRVLAQRALERPQGMFQVHNLTTMGPFETATSNREVLERSFAAGNVVDHYRLDGKVRAILRHWNDRTTAVAETVVRELDYSGYLDEAIEEFRGSPSNPKDRARGLRSIMDSYPEVGDEVIKIVLLLEAQEKRRWEGRLVEAAGTLMESAPYQKEAEDLEAVAGENGWDLQTPEGRFRATFEVLKRSSPLREAAISQAGPIRSAAGDLVEIEAVEERVRFHTESPTQQEDWRLRAARAVLDDFGVEPASGKNPLETVEANPDYQRAYRASLYSWARDEVIETLGLAEAQEDFLYLRNAGSTGMGLLTAREQAIWETGLSHELDNPRFQYNATGPAQGFLQGASMSQIDTGRDQVPSVIGLRKMVAGLDVRATAEAARVYETFNLAGVTRMNDPRIEEILKVVANLLWGAHHYLTEGIHVNIQAVGGDTMPMAHEQAVAENMAADLGAAIRRHAPAGFNWTLERFVREWNLRLDRLIKNGLWFYGGFCILKEPNLLFAAIKATLHPETRNQMLEAFGVPPQLRPEVLADLRRAMRMRQAFESEEEWTEHAHRFLMSRQKVYFEKLLPVAETQGPGTTLSTTLHLPRLPALLKYLQLRGIIAESGRRQDERTLQFRLADWVNKMLAQASIVNRMGLVRKIHETRRVLEELGVPMSEAVIVRGAPYKAGSELEYDAFLKAIFAITDVRGSPGIYILLIDSLLGKDGFFDEFDREGKELVRELLGGDAGFIPPADVRFVGPGSIGDAYDFVPRNIQQKHYGGMDLNTIHKEAVELLGRHGISREQIRAAAQEHGADLTKWSVLNDLDAGDREEVLQALAGWRLILANGERGLFRSYAQAIQGAHVIDLGIPEPELLDLLDEPTRLLGLARQGRGPDAPVALIDATAGSADSALGIRQPIWPKLKELLALGRRVDVEGKPYYTVGYGGSIDETVQQARIEQEAQGTFGEDLEAALLAGDYETADRLFTNFQGWVRNNNKHNEAQDDLSWVIGKRMGGQDARTEPTLPGEKGLRTVRRFDIQARVMSRLAAEDFSLAQANTADLVMAGLFYRLNGRLSREELDARLSRLAQALEDYRTHTGGDPTRKPAIVNVSQDDVDFVAQKVLLTRYEPDREEEQERVLATGQRGAGKAVEQGAERAVQAKRAARVSSSRVAAQRTQQRKAFQAARDGKAGSGLEEVSEGVDQAMEAVSAHGVPLAQITPEAFGRFLGHAQTAVEALVDAVLPPDTSLTAEQAELRRQALEFSHQFFNDGGAIRREAYYERQGGANVGLGPALGELAWQAREDEGLRETVAQVEVLLQTAMFVDAMVEVETPARFYEQLVEIFEMTLDSHRFYALPYLWSERERGLAFSGYSYDEKFALSRRLYGWLYRYLHAQFLERTEFGQMPAEYVDAVLGDATRGVWHIGIGHLENEDLQHWMSFKRFRDLAFWRNEHYMLPFVLTGASPTVFKMESRTNLIFTYGMGDMTVATHLTRAPLLEKHDTNVFQTAYPVHAETGDDTHPLEPQIHDGLTYVSLRRLHEILAGIGTPGAEIDRISGGIVRQFEEEMRRQGYNERQIEAVKASPHGIAVPILVQFSQPAAVHGGYVHDFRRERGPFDRDGGHWNQTTLTNAFTFAERFTWESLAGSGVMRPWQMNILHQEYRDWVEEGLSTEQIADKLLARIVDFMNSTPRLTHEGRLVTRAEMESGGRQMLIALLMQGREFVEKDLELVVHHALGILRGQNAVFKEFLESYATQYLTREAQEMIAEWFSRVRGIPVSLDHYPLTALFDYSRAIMVLGPDGYEVPYLILVLATQEIANFGMQGGLFVLTPEMIRPHYREAYMDALVGAADASIKSENQFLDDAQRREEILREFGRLYEVEELDDIIATPRRNLAGVADSDSHYQMVDAKLMLTDDAEGNLRWYWDEVAERRLFLFDLEDNPNADVAIFDESGSPVTWDAEHPIPMWEKPDPADESTWKPIPYYYKDATGQQHQIQIAYAAKLERNPGQGLMGPYDRMLPLHRKGEGAERLLAAMGQMGAQVMANRASIAAAPTPAPNDLQPQLLVNPTYTPIPTGERISLEAGETGEEWAQWAWERASADLGLSGLEEGDAIAPASLSVVLTHYLVAGVTARYNSSPADLQEALRNPTRAAHMARAAERFLADAELAGHLEEAGVRLTGDQPITATLQDSSYRSRVVQLAMDYLQLEERFTPLAVAPEPLSAEELETLFTDQTVYAGIFSVSPLAEQLELATLQRDFDRFSPDGKAVRVIGVSKEDLNRDATANRFLVADPSGRVREVRSLDSVKIDRAHVLELDHAKELADHREIWELLDALLVPVVNPWESAAKADDKFQTHAILRDAGIATPLAEKAVGIISARKKVEEALTSLVRRHLERQGALQQPGVHPVSLFAQPNIGSRGENLGFGAFEVVVREGEALEIHPEQRGWSDLLEHADRLIKRRDAVLTEERGSATYQGRNVVLKLLALSPDGGRSFQVESGVALVARGPGEFASPAHGAEFVEINAALRDLRFPEGQSLTQGSLSAILGTAAEAARVIGAGQILGVDLLLEFQEDRMVAVVKEVNARPGELWRFNRIEPLDEPATGPSTPLRTGLEEGASAPLTSSLLPQMAAPGVTGIRKTYPLWQWQRMVSDPEGSGFKAMLAEEFHADQIDEEIVRVRTLIDAAMGREVQIRSQEAEPLFDPGAPVALSFAPGRVRYKGGHTDIKGSGEKTINAATHFGVWALTQVLHDPKTAGRVIADNLAPEHDPFAFGLFDEGILPPVGIRQIRPDWLNFAETHGSPYKWEANIKGVPAFIRTDYLDPTGDRRRAMEGWGIRLLLSESTIPTGKGLSTSSALPAVFVWGIQPFLPPEVRLSPQQLNDVDYVAYYGGDRAGTADMTTINLGALDTILVLDSFPEGVAATVTLPPDFRYLIVDSGIERLDAASQEIRTQNFAAFIKSMTGMGPAFATIWLRHLSRSRPREYRQLEELLLTHEAGHPFGLLRELSETGALTDPRYNPMVDGDTADAREEFIRKVMGEIPNGMTVEDIRTAVVEEDLQGLLDGLLAGFTPLLGAHQGQDAKAFRRQEPQVFSALQMQSVIPMRQMALYQYEEGRRIQAYVEAARRGDAKTLVELYRQAHDGDRALWSLGPGGEFVLTPWGESQPKEAFFRSIPEMDELADQFRAHMEGLFAERMGTPVAELRVLAAGLGGAFALGVRGTDEVPVEEAVAAAKRWFDERKLEVIEVRPGGGAMTVEMPTSPPTSASATGQEEMLGGVQEQIRQASPPGVTFDPRPRGIQANGRTASQQEFSLLSFVWQPSSAVDGLSAAEQLRAAWRQEGFPPEARIQGGPHFLNVALLDKLDTMKSILREELPDREVAIIAGDVPVVDFIREDQLEQFPLQDFVQVLVQGRGAPEPEEYPHVAHAGKGGDGVDDLLRALTEAMAEEGATYGDLPEWLSGSLPDTMKQKPIDPQKLALFLDVDGTVLEPKDTFDPAQDGVQGQHFQGERVKLLTQLAGKGVETAFLTAKNAFGDVAAGGVHDDSLRLVVPLGSALEAAGVPQGRIRYDGLFGQQQARYQPAGGLLWSRAELPEGRQPFTLREAAAILRKQLEVVQANLQSAGLQENPLSQVEGEIRDAGKQLGLDLYPQWGAIDPDGRDAAHNPLFLVIEWDSDRSNAVDAEKAGEQLKTDLKAIHPLLPGRVVPRGNLLSVVLPSKLWSLKSIVETGFPNKRVVLVIGDRLNTDFYHPGLGHSFLDAPYAYAQLLLRKVDPASIQPYPNLVMTEQETEAGFDQVMQVLLDAIASKGRYETLPFLGPALSAQGVTGPIQPSEILIFSDVDGTILSSLDTFVEAEDGVQEQTFQADRLDRMVQLVGRGVGFQTLGGKVLHDLSGTRVRTDAQRLMDPFVATLLDRKIPLREVAYNGGLGVQRAQPIAAGEYNFSRGGFPTELEELTDQQAIQVFHLMLEAIQANIRPDATGQEEVIPLPAGAAQGHLVILTPDMVEPAIGALSILKPPPGETLQLAAIVSNARQAAVVTVGLEEAGLTLAHPMVNLQETGWTLGEAIVDIQIRAWADAIETFVVQTFGQLKGLGAYLKIPAASIRTWFKRVERAVLGIQA